MSEIWRWDAHEVARQIKDKKISCVEAVRSCLARLDAVNPAINAIVDRQHDEALAAAAAADEKLRRGDELGDLHGVPVTIKNNTDQAGHVSSNGVAAFADRVAASDSPAVANWRRAGAIIVGRTNTPEFSLRWFTDNPVHGTTLNPWDKARTPGGSSGGAAAALAAGIGALAHGTDSAGSIRYPAFACGVAGLKPSLGRIPSYNASNPGDRPLPAQLVAVQGVLARRVQDLRIGLKALAVGHPDDPWWVPAPLSDLPVAAGSRIAIVSENEAIAADAPVVAAVHTAAKALQDAGFQPEFVSPPHLEEAGQLWLDIVLASNHYNTAPVVNRLGSEKIKRAVQGMLSCAVVPDLPRFLHSLARRDRILREWQLFFERFPAIVMPVSWKAPFALDDDQRGDEAMKMMMKAQSPMFPASILGLPALSVPVRLHGDSFSGVQIIAGRFQEHVCLALAEAIEARLPVRTPIDPVR